MNPIFNTIKVKKPRYNVFDLSHEKKLSCKMGDLIPIMCMEVVPGDKFRVNTEILMRLAPMQSPVMHRMNVYTHYFFVPNRLVYDNWETFITGGTDGKQAPAFPYIAIGSDSGINNLVTAGSLSDFMGINPIDGSITQNLNVSALPFRAYQLIFNEYYRDQTLQSAIGITKGGSVGTPEAIACLELRKRCWEKDYFTSALTTPQRGDDVLLPLQGDIDGEDFAATPINGGSFDGSSPVYVEGGYLAANKSAVKTAMHLEAPDAVVNGSTTINEFRRAVKLQEWLEKNARAGSRYIEQILSHFGIRTPDYRLQRPEYLGGGKNPVIISEVLNTSDTENAPQGNMAGHGISVGTQNRFKKTFEEHGYVFGIMSILPRTCYMNGVDRQLLKFDKFDYYFPEFAHIGEQSVYELEVYNDYSANNNGTFGYQSRYAEYKFKNSSVHGDFRDSMNNWHMARIFTSKPGLNETFVKADPTHRIFAVTDTGVDKCYVQLYNDVKAIRPMPVFGTPSI